MPVLSASARTDRPRVVEQQSPDSRPIPTKADVSRFYLDQGKSVPTLAAAYGYDVLAMTRLMDHYGITRRPRGSRRIPLSDATIADILDRYRAGGTVPGIAAELDLPRSEVRRQVDEAGITRPRHSVVETDITGEQLRAEYESGASVMDLAETHDLTRNSVLEALSRANTQMRPVAPALTAPPATSTGS